MVFQKDGGASATSRAGLTDDQIVCASAKETHKEALSRCHCKVAGFLPCSVALVSTCGNDVGWVPVTGGAGFGPNGDRNPNCS